MDDAYYEVRSQASQDEPQEEPQGALGPLLAVGFVLLLVVGGAALIIALQNQQQIDDSPDTDSVGSLEDAMAKDTAGIERDLSQFKSAIQKDISGLESKLQSMVARAHGGAAAAPPSKPSAKLAVAHSMPPVNGAQRALERRNGALQVPQNAVFHVSQRQADAARPAIDAANDSKFAAAQAAGRVPASQGSKQRHSAQKIMQVAMNWDRSRVKAATQRVLNCRDMMESRRHSEDRVPNAARAQQFSSMQARQEKLASHGTFVRPQGQ